MIKYDKTIVMGIINLSPLSFYKGSHCLSESEITSRMEQMYEEGADIIDIGACSTKPGLTSISEREEWELLKPALKTIYRRFPDKKISIDTFRSGIVTAVYNEIGEYIVNDISAGESDPEMLSKVSKLGLSYIAMHMRGTPSTMQQYCQYNDVTSEVKEYLTNFTIRATEMGIEDIILDPGFGFAKNIEQNYEMINNLDKFKIFNNRGDRYPILVGISRKSMIYKPLNITPEDSLPAVTALHLHSIIKGADILRVHDVKEAVQAVKLSYLLKN